MAKPAGSSLLMVDERSFEQEVLMSELPVLVEFLSARSAACQSIAQDVEGLAHELEGKAKIVGVDIERARMLAQQLRIQTLPTFMLFVQGRPVGGKAGPLRRPQLRQLIEPFLPRAEGAINAQEAFQLRRQGQIVFVDTREPAVYQRAHLPGAVNMPLDEIKGRLAELHMLAGMPLLYCRSGDKTQVLAEEMAQAGVPIAFLQGGLLAWEAEGLPIERPE